MIREICYFLRYRPRVNKLRNELSLAEFVGRIAKELDAVGFAELRGDLVGDLEGKILEIGTGTGATFNYYGPGARVTALEPDEELRAAAEEAAGRAAARICVVPGVGEELPFEAGSFDAVCASNVLCSVASPEKTLQEFKRVLRPAGKIRLIEHIRSEHWLAGLFMDLFNPAWLRINRIGCNLNRKTVESAKAAGLEIESIRPFKIYCKAAPAAFPGRLIKARRPV